MRTAAAVLAAAATIAATGACYREARPAPPPPANKATAPTIRSDDVLAFLPADADLVVGLEMHALRSSEMWAHFVERLSPSDSIKASLAKAQACGIDPLYALQRITIAGRMPDKDKLEGVMVVRGVDGPRAIDCVATFGASAGTVTRQQDTVLIHGNDGEDEIATLVGRSMLVIQFGHGVDATKLAATLKSGSPLRTSRAFMGLYDRREPEAAVWGMLNGNSAALHGVRGLGVAPKTIDGTISVAENLTAVVRVTFATPAEADQLVQMVAPSLSGGKSLVEKLEVSADGTSARFLLTATEAQIEALWGMLGMFVGGGFGGP